MTNSSNAKQFEKANVSTWGIAKGIFITLGSIAGVFVIIQAFNSYVDIRVEKYVRSAGFIQEVASQLRPSVIFDSEGRILYDLGAMKYIDEIKVIIGSEALPAVKVTIFANKFLSLPPLISSMDETAYYPIITNRGQKFNWEFELTTVGIMGSARNNAKLFRVELVP